MINFILGFSAAYLLCATFWLLTAQTHVAWICDICGTRTEVTSHLGIIRFELWISKTQHEHFVGVGE